MSMFENFPYTNLHELNLQWLIEEVKKCYSPDNPPEAMVISVNGESGIVTLYRDAHVNFPDVDAVQWNMYRGSDGVITGIEFNKNAPATRINGQQRFVIYDAGNPPPYPVISVNGQTGAITLYSEAYVEFPDITGDNWGIQRKLNADTENETMVGLMLDDEGNFSITKDEDTIPVYTEDNPPPYPVSMVDGMTGNVNTWGHTANSKINIPIPASGDEWSIGRVIDQGGNLSIKIMYDDNIQKCTAYMIYDDGINTPTPVKLLTLEDIPSSSGVVSVNGQTGVITISGQNIPYDNNGTDTIKDKVDNIETNLSTANTAITNINTNINTLDTRVGNAEVSIGGLNTQVSSLATNLSNLSTLSDNNFSYTNTDRQIGYKRGLPLYRRYFTFSNISSNINDPLTLNSNALPTGADNISISDESFAKFASGQTINVNSSLTACYMSGNVLTFRQSVSATYTYSVFIWVDYTLPTP